MVAGLCLLAAGHAQQLVPTPAPTEAQFADADVRARFVAVEHLTEWWWGRQPELVELARSTTTAQAEALLADQDGVVRAVAIVVLSEQLGYRALPLVEPLLGDAAAAPPSRHNDSVRPLMLAGAPAAAPVTYEERAQTVGHIAMALFGNVIPTSMSIKRVHGERIIGPGALRRAYGDYLESRHEREWSWSRTAALARRLHGGSKPPAPERLEALQRLLAELDTAPEPARGWYLLGLGCEWDYGDQQVVSIADRVAALRALPVAEVMKFLAGEGPGDVWPPNVDPQRFWPDPDVTAAKYGAYPWWAAAKFAIEHGGEWLPPDRLDDWVALAEQHHAAAAGGRTIGVGQSSLCVAGWWQTAARIDPAHTAKWIDRGMALLHEKHKARERGHLMVTASRLLGAEGRRRAVGWFFSGEADQPFHDELHDPAERALLAAILTDERLEDLAPMAMRTLALACNAQRGDGAEPFPGREPYDLSHPLDLHGYQRDPKAAAAKYPAESQALERTLTDWRRRMRAFAAEQLR